MDLDADVEAMTTEDLLAYQQEATRLRLEANAAGRRAQAEVDRRRAEIAERRRAEDAVLGAESKAPAQDLFGSRTADQEESTDG